MAKAVKANGKTVPVLAQLVSASPDPVQYKPYAPHYEFKGVWVRVNVPSEFVVSHTKNDVVLTPDGVTFIVKTLATSLMRGHSNVR